MHGLCLIIIVTFPDWRIYYIFDIEETLNYLDCITDYVYGSQLLKIESIAALLLNGEKSLESRNAPIFKDIAKQQCLIRVGHKDWKYDQKLFDKLNIPKKALELPRGIRRGDIVGICYVGETMPKTQLSDDDIERQVLVSFQASGKLITHISNSKWFSKGHKSPGKPGIYFAQVPTHLLSPHVSSR